MMSACGKRKPQLPSNKHQEIDSAALAMIEMNQQLVQQANNDLATYVIESGMPYVQDDMGFWYMITRHTEGLALQKDQTVTIAQQVYLLDGTLCEDAVQTLQIGKKQVPTAVESALLLLHEGECATMDVYDRPPWLPWPQQRRIHARDHPALLPDPIQGTRQAEDRPHDRRGSHDGHG